MLNASSDRRRQRPKSRRTLKLKGRRRLKLEGLETRLLMASFRSIDGVGNNQLPQRAQLGAAETQVIRFGYPGAYPDGFGDQITRPQAPNPRDVSNAIMAQANPVFNDRNLSDWIVQWGQFLTHDMDLTGNAAANNVLSTGATGDFSIPITDVNDPLGPNPIPFNRSNYDPTTGDNTMVGPPGPMQRPNWREQINHITSFIDASNVYGSDAGRADNLRSFVDGKLKAMAGGLLPGLNDVGEENDNAVGHPAAELFLAGDVRANEQVGLTATHSLFLREHNRLADLIKAQNPAMNDEDIYQWARKIVGAEMQIVTYEEFLPALMGNTAPSPTAYAYAQNVDPSITNTFATAFFRFGHSMQSSQLQLVNDDGSSAGSLSLASIFFNPDILKNDPIIVDQTLKGLASQVSQENDVLLVDDIRNFLFGPPGAGGLDLGALDIQRGRDHGLQAFNDARDAYGLTRLTGYNQLTSDATLQAALQSLYGNFNRLEAFSGVLAEDHLPGKSVGEMLNRSLEDQFTRLRDGDRFFYTGDVDLDDPIVTGVIDLDNLTLADLIRNNTGITNIQDNVFVVSPGFTVTESDGETSVSGTGTTDTISVRLNLPPTSNVVLTVSSDNTGEVTASPASLTFTTANWAVPQPVTVTGVGTSILDGSTTITFSINDALSANAFDPLADQTVTVLNSFDLGDAPSPYPTLIADDGARHDATGPRLGDTRDAEPNGQPTAAADGDGDDEDGVMFGTITIDSAMAAVNIDLQNAASARVDAWLDFDDNGVWDAADQILDNIPVAAGLQTLNFPIPAHAVAGETYARVRVSSGGNLETTGWAVDGEVQDYAVTIIAAPPTIDDIVINGNAPQRNDLTEVAVHFDSPVTAPPSAFVITDRDSGVVLDSLIVNSSLDLDGNTVTMLTFDTGNLVEMRENGIHTLTDGNYQLDIDGSQVAPAGGGPNMAANYAFGDEAADNFFRFYGDNDGDRDTDVTDLGQFGLTFRSNMSLPNYDPDFDEDGDGDVDVTDLGQFGQRFRGRMDF